MRKQTKLVAVLSAAALLAMGASMTSFAAGWQKDDAGVWHYYDSDDEMVTGEWKKDGGKWFYLDEDGDMLTDAWVDDDYYVDESGAMLTNAWKYTVSDEDQDEPDEDGERWFYFNNKGKKVVSDTKKINGKTYLFDSDGKMQFGWQQDGNGEMYYYGDENDGARTESKWLWLERSGNLSDEDLDDGQNKGLCDDTSSDPCDDEGWYWFQSSGKMYKDKTKKKINGKFYMFNEHGQMLYEWIDNKKVSVGSNAQLDAKRADGSVATAGEMLYYNVNEEGWRADGWYQIDGSEAMKTDSDTDWYYIDDGEMYHASKTDDYAGTSDGGSRVYVMRKKVKVSGNKYFAFNEKGQMQDGLQYIVKDHGFFYFDENGYQKTGKVSSVECEDDDYTFYFTTKNGKNGIGYTGEKDGTLYFNGKRLEADDDYKFYVVDGSIYLVNTKGKIQKATNSKKYDDIENGAYVAKDVYVTTNKKGIVSSVKVGNTTTTSGDLLRDLATDINANSFDAKSYENANGNKVAVPFIDLYDSNDVYTYTDSNYAEGWR